MGEAKNKGTFEQRRERALMAGRNKTRKVGKYYKLRPDMEAALACIGRAFSRAKPIKECDSDKP